VLLAVIIWYRHEPLGIVPMVGITFFNLVPALVAIAVIGTPVGPTFYAVTASVIAGLLLALATQWKVFDFGGLSDGALRLGSFVTLAFIILGLAAAVSELAFERTSPTAFGLVVGALSVEVALLLLAATGQFPVVITKLLGLKESSEAEEPPER